MAAVFSFSPWFHKSDWRAGKSQLDEHGDQQNGNAVIAEKCVKQRQRVKHRLGQEVKPAPINQQVKTGDAVIGIGINHINTLGTGKKPARAFKALAGANACPASRKSLR